MAKRKRRSGALAVAALLTAMAAAWLCRELWLGLAQRQAIREAARRYRVDPALIRAVIWRESRFHPNVRGRAGELGLMQIRDVAAQEWADAEHLSGFDHSHCLNPQTNILAGTFYLKKLLNRYTRTDQPEAYALADYNAGRGSVLRWNYGSGASNSSVFIQQIGFPSTREYVQSVIKRYHWYQRWGP